MAKLNLSQAASLKLSGGMPGTRGTVVITAPLALELELGTGKITNLAMARSAAIKAFAYFVESSIACEVTGSNGFSKLEVRIRRSKSGDDFVSDSDLVKIKHFLGLKKKWVDTRPRS